MIVALAPYSLENPEAALIGIAIALAFLPFIGAWIIFLKARRFRLVERQHPDALLIPMIVAWNFANASAEYSGLVGPPSYHRSRFSSPVIAIDSSFTIRSEWGRTYCTPKESVSLIGRKVLDGHRGWTALLFRVMTDGGPIELPMIPANSATGIAHRMTSDEFDQLEARIRSALARS